MARLVVVAQLTSLANTSSQILVARLVRHANGCARGKELKIKLQGASSGKKKIIEKLTASPSPTERKPVDQLAQGEEMAMDQEVMDHPHQQQHRTWAKKPVQLRR